MKVWGPNALSFQLQVGQEKGDRWHCVGRYLPPLDKAGEAQRLLTAPIHAVTGGTWLMILANLNADLDSLRGKQEDVMADKTSEHDLFCMTKQFWCRRKRQHMHGRWTFRLPNYTLEGERRWICGKPDYALVKARDRRRVRSCR